MSCIRERRGYIRVDCTGAGARDLSALYQDFAVACVERQLERALVKANDGNPEDHISLRDAFTAMVLGGIAPGFRIALVAGAAPLLAACLALQRDLRRLGVDAAVFGNEDEADAWLLAYRPPRADRVGEELTQSEEGAGRRRPSA